MTTTITISVPDQPVLVDVRRVRETPRGHESDFVAQLGAGESLVTHVWVGGGDVVISETKLDAPVAAEERHT